MPHTQQEIESALEDLKNAMIESLEVSQREVVAKQAKVASHKRVQLARETVLSLELN